jgi:hypothetical protein
MRAAAEAVTVEVDLAGDTSEAAASMVAVLVAEAWRT